MVFDNFDYSVFRHNFGKSHVLKISRQYVVLTILYHQNPKKFDFSKNFVFSKRKDKNPEHYTVVLQ